MTSRKFNLGVWLLNKYEALLRWAYWETEYDYAGKKALWEIRQARKTIEKIK